ncbi:hypothetical protein T265_00526 [Opisthorchis viverrini]|uniref:Uncharacterized protein n=1 Tax=Opisthorchis viverrini TaxID=6198 RepID=A0A075ACK8_OPIVI|nr:hypothetical protein T265_00526 [Opisthorchis viverrini]KER33635.1 hypothetical protein T265_00526 [Opisthorchis viverrini]
MHSQAGVDVHENRINYAYRYIDNNKNKKAVSCKGTSRCALRKTGGRGYRKRETAGNEAGSIANWQR